MDKKYADRINELRQQLTSFDEQMNSGEKIPTSKCKELTISLKGIISAAKEVQEDINEESRKADDVNKSLDFDMTSCQKRLKHLKKELEKTNAEIDRKAQLTEQQLNALADVENKATSMNEGLEGIDEAHGQLHDRCRKEKLDLDRAEMAVEGLNRSLQALQFRMARAKKRRIAGEEKLSRYDDHMDGSSNNELDHDGPEGNGSAEDHEENMNELISKLSKITRHWEDLERRKKFLQLQIDRVQEVTKKIKAKIADIDSQL